MSGPASPEHERRVEQAAGHGHDDAAVVPRPVEADPRTTPSLPLDLLGTFAVGFGMGTADTVPGFSGGTVALVAGIYERLIANVRQGARALSLLVRGRMGDGARATAAIEWGFVVALLAGVFSAIFALASALDHQLKSAPVEMSALFLGLVIGATIVAVGELRTPALRHLGIGAVVAVVAFVGLGFRSSAMVDPSLGYLFVAGAIAICAMILPGISGSFILVLLGVYQVVISAVSGGDIAVLVTVAAGAAVGLAAFSTLLNWLLLRYHDEVLAVLLGLMVGSARVLWPWPSTEGVGDPKLGAPVVGDMPEVLALSIGAIVAVGAFAAVARRVARNT